MHLILIVFYNPVSKLIYAESIYGKQLQNATYYCYFQIITELFTHPPKKWWKFFEYISGTTLQVAAQNLCDRVEMFDTQNRMRGR